MSMIANLMRVSSKELADYLNDSSLLENRIFNDEAEDENLVDIDQSWNGLIYLLTGQHGENIDHPLLKVLFSDQYINEEQDLGYGPAHYLTPEQVRDLNNQISKITIAELKQKDNPEKMNALGVYPPIWDEGDSAFEFLEDGFTILQEAYSNAAEKGEAMIIFLN